MYESIVHFSLTLRHTILPVPELGSQANSCSSAEHSACAYAGLTSSFLSFLSVNWTIMSTNPFVIFYFIFNSLGALLFSCSRNTVSPAEDNAFQNVNVFYRRCKNRHLRVNTF